MPDTIKIETVDRVQGLTVDYCIFFIPNASLPYSLDPKLFNVATSRARLNTIIVADSTMLQRQMSDDVRKYILKAHEEQFVEFGEHEPKRLTGRYWSYSGRQSRSVQVRAQENRNCRGHGQHIYHRYKCVCQVSGYYFKNRFSIQGDYPRNST